jgi:hypothetical protein
LQTTKLMLGDIPSIPDANFEEGRQPRDGVVDTVALLEGRPELDNTGLLDEVEGSFVQDVNATLSKAQDAPQHRLGDTTELP